MENAGVYLEDLRRARRLTQSDLTEVVEVGRGTIERLESGDDRISVGTVLQVFQALGASPCHYYDLATEKARTLTEIQQQRAVMHGITAYVRALAERKQVPAAVLDEVARASLAKSTHESADSDAISAYALLLALMYLDAPLADLAPIVRAASDHEALGRQLAEARGAFALEMQHAQQNGQAEPYAVPSLDVVVARITALIRYSSDLPTMVKHELSRVEADLRRYRALIARAVGNIMAEPRSMRKRSTKKARQAPVARGSRQAAAFDRRTRQGEDEPTVTATIVAREPDAAYPEGLVALGDALVLQMFDSGLGETLRMAYTMLQNHQERQNRRAARSAAADALRDQLAQLDDGTDV